MAKDVIMPALGMAQETGLVMQWFNSEGDTVKKGEPLLEIETDKAVVEIEAPASGTLVNITALAGDEVPVGHTIALIVAEGEAIPPKPTQAASTPAPAKSGNGTPSPVMASPIAARMAAEHHIDLGQITPSAGDKIQKADVEAYLSQQQPAGNGSRVLASPKARRLASEQNVALEMISGSGPGGAVLAADVIAMAEAVVEGTIVAPAETFTVSKTWRVMADRLTQSWTSVPHFYLVRETNASALQAWYQDVKARATEKITYTDLLTKLVATALREHPRVNASWVDGQIVANPDVNVGLAVATDDGLVVPVVHQADTLSLNQIAARRKAIVERAQAGRMTLDDMSNGTFTISNLGMYGIDAFNAIVNPPQAAILAVGRIAERVVAVNGQPAVQPVMILSMSFDHRVVDGARGAQFLQTLGQYIESPLSMLD
jgi:pyruvate dehydrogenase E2 component (dihydrolipoamide acetyltransferase)